MHEQQAAEDARGDFADPVSGTIVWSHIESLLVAVGCDALEGNCSRVRFRKDPEKEAKPYQVREVRDFLKDIGVRP